MAASSTKLIVIIILTVLAVSYVAVACEDCSTGARQMLRELARALF
jgi:hypothetical protein